MPNNIDQYLNTIKTAESGESVRDAVINALKNIHNDTPITNITHGHGIMPERGSRTFEPPAGTVWDSFTADPASGSTQAQVIKELEVTQNDTYEEDNVLYNKVVVKVPQTDKDICQEVFEITENNREYDPMLEGGWDGFGKIKVNISSIPVSGQFTVKFYGPDRTTVIDTQLVDAYGYASCTKLDGTIYLGQNFKGWNPSPSNVTRDLNCYPVYGDYIIDPGEIQETWEQICADGGAHVPIGGYKNLVINVYANRDWNDPLAIVKWRSSLSWADEYDTKIIAGSDNQLVFSYPYYMVKVAEGEDGTHSTWISTGAATLHGNFRWTNEAIGSEAGHETDTTDFLCYYKAPFGNWPYCRNYDWEMCPLRQLLNGKVFASLEPALQNNIKQVTKFSRGLSEMTPNGVRIQKSTLDKIWPLSAKELHSLFAIGGSIHGTTFPQTMAELEEVNGIDYSSQYMPTYPFGTVDDTPWVMRTEVSSSGESQVASPLLASERGSDHGLIKLWTDSVKQSPYIPFGFCL